MKLLKGLLLVVLLLISYYVLVAVKEHQALGEQLIRLHVVGESNSEEDQSVKLVVRDAILEKIKQWHLSEKNKDEIMAFLSENLADLQTVANAALEKAGVSSKADVTLMKEAFPLRIYDTFTLPAGVYDSLRVVIGAGEGENWWCVIFPGLCIPAASQEVEDVAVSAGLSEELGKTITNTNGYEIRFFFLDFVGRVENYFFRS